MARVIATIGYEGTTLEAFIRALRRAGVDHLVDVRAVALSRKQGFSKSQLAAALAASGIEYTHLRGLGDPKDGRLAARAGDYREFERIFSRHMKTAAAREDLETAVDLVSPGRACLMCFEADHSTCHRRIVAESLAKVTGLKVMPLQVVSEAVAKIAA